MTDLNSTYMFFGPLVKEKKWTLANCQQQCGFILRAEGDLVDGDMISSCTPCVIQKGQSLWLDPVGEKRWTLVAQEHNHLHASFRFPWALAHKLHI